jgi:hypothetical protein
MQWYNNDTHEIGVYEPNYTPEQSPDRGKLIEWNAGAFLVKSLLVENHLADRHLADTAMTLSFGQQVTWST